MNEMEFTIFTHHGGMGYISNTKKIQTKKESLFVGGTETKVGEKTNLFGFFNKPIEYVGIYDELSLFYLGSKKNIFENKHYFQAIYILSDDSIYSMYGHNCGRDFWLKNGVWK